MRRLHAADDHLPIVVLTDRDDPELAREALRAGAQDSLAKESVDGVLLSRALAYAIERKASEGLLRQKERELEHAVKMEVIGRLAGGIAHDFNNLLTSIHGYASIVLNSLDKHDLRAADVGEIIKSSVRAAALTRQLTAFSRKEACSPVVLDLNDVIRDAHAMLVRVIGEDVELEIGESSDLKYVRADRNQIEQVVLNLAVNARDAMPEGGSLRVSVSNTLLDPLSVSETPEVRPGEYVELRVQDTGTGIDSKVRQRIFEPFFTTKMASNGTGLGLSIVYGIVKQNGGHVSVVSTPGEGTVFSIYLPVIDDLPDEETQKPGSSSPRGTETVLVVEDDPEVRLILERSLSGLGYTPLIASTGAEAEQICRDSRESIDLVFSDVVLPDVTGPEMVRNLSETRPDMKVVFMSAYPGDTLIKRGLANPEVPFIGKPFSPAEMARKLREVLDHPACLSSQV